MPLPKKIAIIGVGLIGGSIAMGLKQRLGSKITILGACSTLKRAKITQSIHIIDQAVVDINSIPGDVQIVILASPIHTNIKLIKRFASLNSKNTVFIDISSTKSQIAFLARKLSLPFIPTHPMAGKESSGFENADANLFVNKPWIVCPGSNVKPQLKEMVENLIALLGANIILMDPGKHDELIGLVSHLPLFVSHVLLSTIHKKERKKTIAAISSTGFQDMTRLAHHNDTLKNDILKTNRKNVIAHLSLFSQELNLFINQSRNQSYEHI